MTVGAWQIDPLSLRFIKDDKSIKVQPKVMELLLYLAQFPEQVILREELIKNVWPEVSATDDTLNNMVGKLRKVLIADSQCQSYIETVPKKGYCLRAEVVKTAKKEKQKIQPKSFKKPLILGFTVAIIAVFLFFMSQKVFIHSLPSSTIDLDKPLETLSITSHQALEIFPEISPNNKHIAFIRAPEGLQSNQLIIKDIDSGNERILNDIAGLYGNPVWSGNSENIAYIHMSGSTCTVRLVNMQGGPSRLLSSCSGELIRTMRKSLTWDKDTNSVIFTKNQETKKALALFKVDIVSGQALKLTNPPENMIGDANPSVSPNGKLIAFTRTNESGVDKIMVLNIVTNIETEFATKSQNLLGIDWLDNDSVIYISDASSRSELVLLNVTDGSEALSRISGRSMLHPSFNTASRQLIFSELQSNANIVISKRLNENHSEKLIELKSSKFEREVVFSDDGQFIVYTRLLANGSELWLYDLTTKEQKRLVKPDNAFFKSIAISPDNTKIVLNAITEKNSSIQIYDIERQHFFNLETVDIKNPQSPSWLADSKRVLFTSKKSELWLIWQTSVNDSNPTLITQQGGNIVVESDDGKNVYFSRQGEVGLWQLSLIDTQATPVKMTQKITEEFQTWKMKNGIFYFLKRQSIPSKHIYVYTPENDEIKLYYQSSGAFNYFDINHDLVASAQLKQFSADIFVMQF
ncbi:winged helix-turn-helix domain-containing protein [Pseudoalteromonas denitrificans]|uniref:DNA-binding winged helix-turn-helix (WHTH) domain-containing protein n=1 Tax=Pseudoalteromonas denitrificans DSM 6059 TaxID=1123010 RepID=A0A1I1NB13_9GAMM|nr:winged helix-turn-helix domain-containing protein [Pseudoalteromonas denitrificans]SFC94829.1 DNA-binding winged helix-turn-helix (wHTH) domain-containing protein [Pseudoalteromonas denitrificans DSM 6059]